MSKPVFATAKSAVHLGACLCLGAIIYLACPPPASAYVLPGSQVLKRMIATLGNTKRLMVSQTLHIYPVHPIHPVDSGPTVASGLTLDETLRYHFPEHFRSDIRSENVTRIYTVSAGQALMVMDGKSTAASNTGVDLYKDILLYRNRLMLENRLSALGVDLTVSGLGLFEGRVAYVLGARYPDETPPQLWIEKESFLPLRWLIGVNSGDTDKSLLEIRYQNWQKKDQDWYPMLIGFYQNGLRIREITVNDLQANPVFSDNLFDIEYLKSMYPPAPSALTDNNGSELLDEVKKTIEEFKKMYQE